VPDDNQEIGMRTIAIVCPNLEIVTHCLCPEQGVKLLGLLLTGSTGQHMAGRNGLA
jgi:hypothetical protein